MKPITLAIIIAVAVIGGAFIFTGNKNNLEQPITKTNNVTIINGKQIIEINAKGGYQPRQSTAKAGIPTVLRFKTNGTFDCSSSVRIPSLNISKSLPQNGSTDIDIGTQTAGLFRGSCGMGMYPFEVDFQS